MKNYQNEQEFLKDYDKSQFDLLSVTSDIIIFSVSSEKVDNYRKLSKKKFSVLLIKRDNYPDKDKYCLPGGFVRINETTEEAAIRVLKDETNLNDIYLEQLYTFSDVKRDPRMRIIATSYMALIDKSTLKEAIISNASWFNIDYLEDEKGLTLILDNNQERFTVRATKKLIEYTNDQYEYQINSDNHLAFDHALIILKAIERLKNKIEYSDIVFNMMPEYFTLKELQQVYEVILGKKLLDPAFRRIIAKKVEKTTKEKTGGGHRPSTFYTYKR